MVWTGVHIPFGQHQAPSHTPSDPTDTGVENFAGFLFGHWTERGTEHLAGFDTMENQTTCNLQYKHPPQFVTALLVERQSPFTRTPLLSAYEDMLITILRTAMRPDYSVIFIDNKLETAACFVLNKERLVVSILGQLLFGCLIIEGILILKLGLVIHSCNKGLAVLVLPLGSEM
jgi:hypothetical protein